MNSFSAIQKACDLTKLARQNQGDRGRRADLVAEDTARDFLWVRASSTPAACASKEGKQRLPLNFPRAGSGTD